MQLEPGFEAYRLRSSAVYPDWQYFPRNAAPPKWCDDFVGAVLGAQECCRSLGMTMLAS